MQVLVLAQSVRFLAPACQWLILIRLGLARLPLTFSALTTWPKLTVTLGTAWLSMVRKMLVSADFVTATGAVTTIHDTATTGCALSPASVAPIVATAFAAINVRSATVENAVVVAAFIATSATAIASASQTNAAVATIIAELQPAARARSAGHVPLSRLRTRISGHVLYSRVCTRIVGHIALSDRIEPVRKGTLR